MASKLENIQVYQYTRTLIKLLQWHQRDLFNPIYAIVEVELRPTLIAKIQRLFIGKKIFLLIYIIRGA